MEASQQLRDIISISIPDFDCEEGWRSIIESAILCIDRYYKRRAAVEEIAWQIMILLLQRSTRAKV